MGVIRTVNRDNTISLVLDVRPSPGSSKLLLQERT